MSEPDLFAGFDICGRRSRGNARSQQAHHAGRERRPTQAQRIVTHLRECGDRGAICEEIALALAMRYTTVSARLSEMKECGWIAIAGQRPTTTGSAADVLRLTERAPGKSEY